MSGGEDKQLFLELPLQERTIAVALKHIFDQVKKLEDAESQEIQKVHLSFIGKFKEVEERASKIIKGGAISAQNLKNKQTYFNNEQLPKVEEILKSNKGIEAYWLTALLNFLGDDMSVSDKEIATAIIDISTDVTNERLQLNFQVGANPWLAAGKYKRTFVLKDGIPSKSQGTPVTWLKGQPEGVLSTILRDNLTPEEVAEIFPTVGEIINEVVPYSLEYFLGAVEQEDGDEEQQQDLEDDEQEEEQEDSVPAKKVKK